MSGVNPSETDVTSHTTHRDDKITLSVLFERPRPLALAVAVDGAVRP